jgi:hypothetical protein
MLKARTKLACRIANVDPARFNEAVHFGKYPCAPRTDPGVARVFDVEDIIVLRFFGMMLSIGFGVDLAGKLCCEVLSEIRRDKTIAHVSLLRSNSGMANVFAGCVNPELYYGGFHDKAFWMTFGIADMRAYVEHHLNEEASILGED